MIEPGTRTGHYWIVWEERRGRLRLRAISHAGAVMFLLLALLAASAGILVALTQHDFGWVGWGWAVWVLGVAVVGGRVLMVKSEGLIRHSSPFGVRHEPKGSDSSRSQS